MTGSSDGEPRIVSVKICWDVTQSPSAQFTKPLASPVCSSCSGWEVDFSGPFFVFFFLIAIPSRLLTSGGLYRWLVLSPGGQCSFFFAGWCHVVGINVTVITFGVVLLGVLLGVLGVLGVLGILGVVALVTLDQHSFLGDVLVIVTPRSG